MLKGLIYQLFAYMMVCNVDSPMGMAKTLRLTGSITGLLMVRYATHSTIKFWWSYTSRYKPFM